MTDAFTTTAFESAASKYQGDWDAFEQEPVDDYGLSEAERRAHVAGWKAARDHLAAQEPTNAECVAVLNVKYGGTVGPHDEPYDAEEMAEARAALTAAREARA